MYVNQKVYLLLFLFELFNVVICAGCGGGRGIVLGLTCAELFQFSSVVHCCHRQNYRHCDAASQENIANHVKPTSTQHSEYLPSSLES